MFMLCALSIGALAAAFCMADDHSKLRMITIATALVTIYFYR